MKHKTVGVIILELKDLEDFKAQIRHVFVVAQTASKGEDYGFTLSRTLSMIDDEIDRLKKLETTEEC